MLCWEPACDGVVELVPSCLAVAASRCSNQVVVEVERGYPPLNITRLVTAVVSPRASSWPVQRGWSDGLREQYLQLQCLQDDEIVI